MSLEEMTDEIITLTIAGIETTATCLTWACYRLARQPALGDRPAAEAPAVLAGQPADR
ncbi:cytochrome P450 [Streptomyces sp. 3N207]|uniref:cytochrome P450 n=1 Tax=Streptomyces sp. 3N207 TaxID=3457417 RepID=UPI003FD02B82